MDIALFDLYTEGHHLPYARNLKRALEGVSNHRITFVTVTETDRCLEFFTRDEVVFLQAAESAPVEGREEDFSDIADEVVSQLVSAVVDYDVIHLLYADDILSPLWRHWSCDDGPRVIGELNGTFFHRGTVFRERRVHTLLLKALQSPLREVIDLLVPERSSHESLWQDLYLYRCLTDGTFDNLIVHTREAANYVKRLDTQQTTPVSVVPYPAPAQYGNEITRQEARERLDLPQDASILLFFGVLRNERGVDIMLEALRRYQGPEFTLLIAGPPVAVDETEVKKIDESSPVNILSEFRYINEPEVYYRASDAVVLPYKREFGKEKQSQMLQEVCSSLRPAIASDFGVIGRCVEEWDLGVTFEPESADSLAMQLTKFATDGIPFSEEDMVEYTNQHSYERIATELVRIYDVNAT